MMNNAHHSDMQPNGQQSLPDNTIFHNSERMGFESESQRPSLSESDLPYYIISEPWEIQQLSNSILQAATTKNETPILGIDCEGLAKRRTM